MKTRNKTVDLHESSILDDRPRFIQPRASANPSFSGWGPKIG